MKKQKWKKRARQNRRAASPSQIFLSFSSLLSLYTWLKFVPRHVFHHNKSSVFDWSSDIHIYHNIYIRRISFSSRVYTRAHSSFLRAHKQTQRWPRRSAAAARRWRRWWKKIIIAIRLIDLEEDLLFPIRTTLTTGWEQQRRTKERTE